MFEPELNPKPKSIDKVDILLVDYRPENLLTLESFPVSPSLNLIKASSGDNPLRYLLDHEPAVILLDLQMPKLDGFETASIIKSSERTRDIAGWYAVHLGPKEGEIKLAALRSFHVHARDLSPTVLEQLGISQVFDQGQSYFVPETKVISFGDSQFTIHSALLIPLTTRGKTIGVMTWLKCRDGTQFSDDDFNMAEDLGKRISVAIESAIFHQVAQVTSHELKTPLTPLKLQTQILSRMLREAGDPETKNEKVEKIVKIFDRQLDRLSLLVEELLDISKMTNGKLSLSLEEFDVVELTEDILNRFAEQLASVSCKVSFEPQAKGGLQVCWDRFRMEQVIVNLITNAAKYGHGKPIDIKLVERSGMIEISVRDHGIGIAPNDLNRIFNRFERSVSSQHFAGLGLGLYIVSQLLEAHGGKISVTSEVGKGSVFTIAVPTIAVQSASKDDVANEKMDFAVQYAKSAAVELRS